MITAEEKEQIINEAIERMSLAIPTIVGNLMANKVVMSRLNKEFFGKYPEFKNSIDSVTEVLEEIESENPGEKYEYILEKAVPRIKERIGTIKRLDTSSNTNPNPNRLLEGILDESV